MILQKQEFFLLPMTAEDISTVDNYTLSLPSGRDRLALLSILNFLCLFSLNKKCHIKFSILLTVLNLCEKLPDNSREKKSLVNILLSLEICLDFNFVKVLNSDLAPRKVDVS